MIKIIYYKLIKNSQCFDTSKSDNQDSDKALLISGIDN